MSKANRHPSNYEEGHGMKGIIGANRAKNYVPSSYDGDHGGSAGANGLHGYGGAPLHFEGGHRGGGVSEPETLPSQEVFLPKKGFDERAHGAAEGNVHGLPGVEGIKPPTHRPGDHGMEGNEGSSGTEMTPGSTDGYACAHGCGSMKSKHGLARHYFAKHGGFGGLGHALGGSHGSSYKPGEEFKGETETEGKPQMKAIKKEFEAAKPSGKKGSSYEGGDCG